MRTLPDDVLHHMIATCPGRTDEALQSAFGISYNTWRRICRGDPVRSSVAERLIDRIRAASRNIPA